MSGPPPRPDMAQMLECDPPREPMRWYDAVLVAGLFGFGAIGWIMIIRELMK